MAKDIKLLVGGNVERAEKAMRELQRTGSDVAHRLERDFNQLGTTSTLAFDKKRQAATSAYERIKASGIATSDELKRAEKALGAELLRIDEDQYGKRMTLGEKFNQHRLKIAAGVGVIAAAGAAAISIGKKAVNEYAEFQSAIVDLGKVTDEPLAEVEKKIMALPPELGSATELVKGYYQTISAGVTDPAKAMDLLTVAAKASKAAHVDQSQTIQGLTKLMAGFSGEIETATEASDLLFAMEKNGQTTFAELVPVIGDVSSLSAQLNVNSKEMAAMFSRITQTAGSTSQAATQYKAILNSLIKPTGDMEKALKAMGYESGALAIEQEGLAGVLQSVKEYSESSGVGLGKLFGSTEALIGLGPLLSNEFEGYNQTLNDIEKSAGGTQKAFAEWSGTFAAVKEAFDNSLGKTLISLGKELTPMAMEALSSMTSWMETHKPQIVQFAEGVQTVFKAVATAAGWVYDAVGLVAKALAQLTIWVENAIAKIDSFFSSMDASSMDYGGVLSSGSSTTSTSDSEMTNSTKLFPNLSYATGTSYVPETGYYQLHRGESVSTRSETAKASQAGGNVSFGDVSFVLPNVTNQSSARDLARQAMPEILNLMKTRYRAA